MFNLKLNITGESTGTPGGVPHGPDEGLPVQSPDSHRSPSGVSRESPGSILELLLWNMGLPGYSQGSSHGVPVQNPGTPRGVLGNPWLSVMCLLWP